MCGTVRLSMNAWRSYACYVPGICLLSHAAVTYHFLILAGAVERVRKAGLRGSKEHAGPTLPAERTPLRILFRRNALTDLVGEPSYLCSGRRHLFIVLIL